jgi:hypothetical protein
MDNNTDIRVLLLIINLCSNLSFHPEALNALKEYGVFNSLFEVLSRVNDARIKVAGLQCVLNLIEPFDISETELSVFVHVL